MKKQNPKITVTKKFSNSSHDFSRGYSCPEQNFRTKNTRLYNILMNIMAMLSSLLFMGGLGLGLIVNKNYGLMVPIGLILALVIDKIENR